MRDFLILLILLMFAIPAYGAKIYTELSDRMAKDQTQASDARSVLSKLSKEARDAKANPAWLE